MAACYFHAILITAAILKRPSRVDLVFVSLTERTVIFAVV